MNNDSEKNNQSKDEKEEKSKIRNELDYLKDTIKNLKEEYDGEVDVEYLEDDELEGEEEMPRIKEDSSKVFGIDLGSPEKIMDMIGKMGPLTENLKKMFSASETGEKRESINPIGFIGDMLKNVGSEQKIKEEEHEVIKINKEEMDDFSDTVAFILKTAGTKECVKLLNVLAERGHFTGELGVQVNLRGEELRKNLEELDRTGLINYSNEESKPHEITTYGRALINTMKKLFMNDFS
jgi:predicted transcriptional regulator